MQILVCVKQVPDPEQVAVGEGAEGGARVDPGAAFRMNRFDEFAVEEALRIKEALAAGRIDVLTVGPEAALDALKRAVGMGADRGVLIQTGEAAWRGPAAVACRVAAYAREKDYDLLLTGSLSEDGMSGQVGPMTAGFLGWPCATQVIALDALGAPGAVSVERELEGGARERLELGLPAVLSLQTGINRPRYPSLSNLLRAGRQPVEVVSDPGEDACPDPVLYLGAVLPPRSRAGAVLRGSPREKAEGLLRILREKAFIR